MRENSLGPVPLQLILTVGLSGIMSLLYLYKAQYQNKIPQNINQHRKVCQQPIAQFL
jgi:hypothetical protein